MKRVHSTEEQPGETSTVPAVTIRRDGDINFNHEARVLTGLNDSRNKFLRLWVDRDTNEMGFSLTRTKRDEDGAITPKIQRNKSDVRFTALQALNALEFEIGESFVCPVRKYSRAESKPKWAFTVPKRNAGVTTV